MLIDDMKELSESSSVFKDITMYITQHIDTIDEIMAKDIVASANVSTSSIIRYCKKLGFSGFREMKIQLIRDHMVLSNNDGSDMTGLFGMEELISISDNLLMAIQYALKDCKEKMDITAIDKACRVISESDNLCLISLDDAYSYATEKYCGIFREFGINTTYIEKESDVPYTVRLLSENDCVIAVERDTGLMRGSMFIDHALNNRIPVIVITNQGYINEDASITVIDVPYMLSDESVEARFIEDKCFMYFLDLLVLGTRVIKKKP
ncbi:MAG: MurR/RpiR family transcriptional regulator [Erysipelotrichaceae bacterium]|nr:MurR/RpiR family transcriptional regulator [Erysipelotrichaceae bacterium]